MTVVRLNRQGRPDTRFAGDGIAMIALGRSGECNLTELALRPDGRILLAGRTRERHRGRRPALVQLRPNGSLDRSFGHRGLITVRSREEGFATSLALLPGGSVLLGGQIGSKVQPFLLAFDRHGRPNRVFNLRTARTLRRLPADERGSLDQILPAPKRIILTGGGRDPFRTLSPRGSLAGWTALEPGQKKQRRYLAGAALQGGRLVAIAGTYRDNGFDLRRYR